MGSTVDLLGICFGSVIGFFLGLASVVAFSQTTPEYLAALICFVLALFYIAFAGWCWRNEFGKKKE